MEKKIKVLQFTVAATKGGRTLYVLNNWRKINKEKFQVDFITFSPTLDFEDELAAQGSRVYHLSAYPEADKEQFVKEFDAVLDQGYDVIHIHTSYWKDTIVEERAKAKGVKKIIIHSHNTGCGNAVSEEEAQAAEVLHKKIRDQLTEDVATDFWACSESAAEWLYGDRLAKNKIKIMKNAIDTERFSYSLREREKIRKKLNVNDKIVVGTVGRLAYQKNPFFLLDVFCEVAKSEPDAVLLFVGQGILLDELKERARQLGIFSKVLFVGFTEQAYLYYQAMDIFAFPSLFEGFGLSLLEAQISGLKCVVSENIQDEVMLTENVKKIPLHCKQNWINEISDLCRGYDRKDQSEVIKKNGYDIEEQIREIEKLYCEGIII